MVPPHPSSTGPQSVSRQKSFGAQHSPQSSSLPQPSSGCTPQPSLSQVAGVHSGSSGSSVSVVRAKPDSQADGAAQTSLKQQWLQQLPSPLQESPMRPLPPPPGFFLHLSSGVLQHDPVQHVPCSLLGS
jgi:hypothetical protein